MAPRNGSKKGKGKEELPRSEYAPPTQEEFLKMKQYNKFSIPDAEGNLHPFSRFETATILPDDIDPGEEIEDHEYWVAKIVDIRGVVHADDDSNDVWVEVRWYYSPKDVAGIIKSFCAKEYSPYERMPSDHYDIVSVEAFNEAVKVYEFKDDNLDQQYIPTDAFYTRYEFKKQSRLLTPKPGADSCVCHKPYAPANEGTIMHFCPRPNCRTWYHQDCLVKADFTAIKVKAAKAKASSSTHPSPSKSTASTSKSPKRPLPSPSSSSSTTFPPPSPSKGKTNRAHNLLSTSPDTDTPQRLTSLLLRPRAAKRQRLSQSYYATSKPTPTRRPGSTSSASSSSITLKRPSAALKVKSFARISPLKLKKQTSSSSSNIASRGDDSEEDEEAQAALSEALDSLPAPLLAAATQPIVRAPKLYLAGGLVGNVGPVVRARRIVYEVLGGSEVPVDWEEKVLKGFSGDEEVEGAALGMEGTVVKFKGRRGAVKGVVCPECGSAI
ncbi:hypothetical protein D9611_008640 [Ephemerocybe angulata]|uniref:BAH domain-containing protein n=1 Tax=Ephemerocybe angulata TaxID=980116 RepID=A0A8H5AYK5_9AGAR|nr:hypothetical protein D9611_008640 [Tulosesus angulatus]